MCFPVLAKRQICVQGDLPGAQSQRKNLVWQKEKSSLPWFSLASPSHIFSTILHPVFQISQREAYSLFYAAQLLRGGYPFFWGKQKAGVSSSLRIKIQFFPTVLQTLLRKACIRSTPAITAASKAAASSPSPSAIRSPAGMSPHAGWPKPTPSKAQRIWEI